MLREFRLMLELAAARASEMGELVVFICKHIVNATFPDVQRD
jgi:hypothetical protein